MEISKRLQTIASLVPPNTNMVADIGTDHGYIPIYLIRNNIAKKCIACDINRAPLMSAKQNINAYKLTHFIETRLGDGLSKMNPGESDVIIIAGMGGMLMIDILNKDLGIVKVAPLLILQPQLDVDKVRKYIHSINFTIIDEQMVYEDGKYYTIIKATAGKEKPYSHIEYLFGKKLMENQPAILKEFISKKTDELIKIQANLKDKDTSHVQKRLEEIEKELLTYKEVLGCL